MKGYQRVLLAASAGIALALPPGAAAQALEEVVVTARKREEALQDVGVSVSAVTAQMIDRQGLNSIRELSKQIPGLTFQESFGRRDDRPGIRGSTSIGTADFGVESGTAIFIDGVYIQADTSAFGLHDVERVEVVRGPQSALYGRNSYAGAINFVTQVPGDEPRLSFEGRYGRYDEVDLTAGASGRLNDMLAANVFLRHYEFGSQYEDAFDGNTVGDEETNSISAALFVDPADWLSVRTRFAYSRDNDGHIPFTMADANVDFAGDGINPFAGDDYFVGELPTPAEITGDEDIVGPLNESLLFESGMERDTTIVTLRADVDLPRGWTLAFLGGYHKEDRQTGSDSASTGTFASGLSLLPFTDRNLTDWSAELRLESDHSRRVRGLVGLFYFREDREEDGFSYDGIAPFTPVFRPDSLQDPAMNRNVTLRETRNWAVFGAVSFDITDKLTGSIEGRYGEDLKRIVGSDRDGPAPTRIKLFPARETFTSFTARIMAEYQVREDFLAYAILARGTKPGGFNDTNNRDPQPILTLLGGEQQPSFDQETQRTAELGFKTTWLGGRLRANLAGFVSQIEDAQLTQTYSWCVGAPAPFCFIPGFGGELRTGANIDNIEEVGVIGAELEVQAALTDYLDVSLGYAFVDSEIDEGSNRDHGRLFPDFDGVGPEASLDGLQFPRISRHQVNWTANFRQALEFGELFANLSGSYESRRWVQVSNLAEIPEATLVNLRGGLRFGRYEVALWGENVFDEDAPVDALRFRNGDFVRGFQIANRRGATYGVDVRLEF